MPRVSVSVKDAQTFEPVPDDMYPATVHKIEGPIKGPNSNYLKVQFKVSEGEHEGRIFFRNFPVDGKGAGFFVEFWELATGEQIELGPDAPDLDVDTDDALGAAIGIVTKQSEYEGKTRSEIDSLVAL